MPISNSELVSRLEALQTATIDAWSRIQFLHICGAHHPKRDDAMRALDGDIANLNMLLSDNKPPSDPYVLPDSSAVLRILIAACEQDRPLWVVSRVVFDMAIETIEAILLEKTLPPIPDDFVLQKAVETQLTAAIQSIAPSQCQFGVEKRGGGRPRVTKLTPHERKVWRAWKSNNYRTYHECDKALGASLGTTQILVQRIKKRKHLPQNPSA